MINGSRFPNETDQVSVFLGRARCNVTAVSTSSVTCTASRHVAGSYRVGILVHGVGFSSGDACFLYLLSVDSITPNVGGISGGYEVTITGEGFLELSNVYVADLPWIQKGIGLPLDRLNELNFCSQHEIDFDNSKTMSVMKERNVTEIARKIEASFKQDNLDANYSSCLSNEVINSSNCSVYTDYFTSNISKPWLRVSGVAVLIGRSPCIVTQATGNTLNCTTVLTPPGQLNVTVSVFSETAIMERAFKASLEETPSVASVQPNFGPVTGNETLTIYGLSRYNDSYSNTSNLRVFIGSGVCAIQHANNSHMECTSGSHDPGLFHIWIVTPEGIAVLDTFLSDMNDTRREFEWIRVSTNSSVFPLYEHKLLAGAASGVRGSVAGGSQLVITGGVFTPGYTEVFIGGILSEIAYFSREKLVVILPSTTKTVYIQLQRRIIGKVCIIICSWHVA